MEFSVERNELLAALYLTQGIVERRTTIPVLANVCIETLGNGIRVSATDQEVSVQRDCAAESRGEGRLTTPARTLYDMVRQLPETELRVRVLDNNWIDVTAGRSRFRLVGMDPSEFPSMPVAPQEGSPIRLTGAMLGEMIEHTGFAMSSDEARANLSGIYAECPEEGKLRMVATDGHRLAMITRDVEGAVLEKGVILPRKAIGEIRKILESGEQPVDLCIQEGVAHVQRGPVQMSFRLVEGEFPDYTQVVPSSPGRISVVDTAAFLAALRRVSIVSSERTRGVKVEIETGRMQLSSMNPDVGEAADEVEVEYDGEPVAIGFNARYLIDVLSVLPAGGSVELALIDDVSPGVLRDVGDSNYCYIVMPMRL